jgi:hypothetical protein
MVPATTLGTSQEFAIPPIRPDEKPNQTRNLVLQYAALCLLAYFAIIQISRWPARLRYPGEEDGAEGTQLTEMVHLRRGEHIYRVPSNGEFDGAIYGPLCYLTGAAVIDPSKPEYLPLRLLSLLATAGIVILAAAFVRSLTKQKLGAATTVVLLLSTIFLGRYGISARPDMMALLLAFAGFVVFAQNRGSRRALMVAATLMLLSFFYKQQFIGAPISIFAYLVFERRFRAALEFAALMAGGGAALVAAFSYLVFPHQAFLLHFLSYNHLPFDTRSVVPEILMFVVPLFLHLLGSADFLDEYPDKLLINYALISSGMYFLLLFSSSSGADTNRCLEPAVVLSCLLAARLTTPKRVAPAIAWTSALAFVLTLLALLRPIFVVPRVTQADFAADTDLQSYLRSNFSPTVSALSYYPADPLRAGLKVPVANWWHYSQLIRAGKLSDQDIISRIHEHGYGVILLDFDLKRGAPDKMANFYTTPAIRDAILRSYEQSARLIMPIPEVTRYTDGKIYVWRPRLTENTAGVAQ